ncbi:MAG: TIM barrel protein [Sphingomicrobium sp.]
MKLSPCIEWIYAAEHQSMGDRLRAVSAAGYAMGEFHSWRDKDVDGVAEALAETGATLTGVCVDPRRSMVDPSQHEELLQAIEETIEATRKLGSPPLIIASGFTRPGVPREEHVAASIEVLKRAAELAERANVILILEPLNDRIELPNMFLTSTTLALDIIEAVDSPNLKLLYDVYHSKVMDEDISEVLKGRMHLVHHVQVADVPGRHEPGTGTIDWKHVMSTLRDYGYEGPIGLEYLPTMPPGESLAKAKAALGA